MRSIKRKSLAVVLSMMLVLNCSVPAFAAEGTTQTNGNQTTTTSSETTKGDTYTITTSALHGTIDENASVESGKNHTISYKADKGYALSMILVDGVRMSVKEYEKSYTFVNVTKNHAIKVIFVPEAEINIKSDKFTISSTVKNGTITKTTDVTAGGEVTIHYEPNEGYVLSKIVIDGETVDSDNFKTSYTFTAVAKNHNIEVEFELADNSEKDNTYTIRTSAENGTITETSTQTEGSSKTVKYTANDGYTLSEVLIDGVKVDIKEYPNSYTFTNINHDHSVVVTFTKNSAVAKDTYTISTTVSNGTITEKQSVVKGGSATITYKPDAGYSISRVSVDGVEVDKTKFASSYTFSNVDKDHSIRVVYRKAASTATVSSTGTSKTSASKAKTRSASSTQTGSDADTGDSNNALPYAMLALGAGLSCTGLALSRRKRQN